MKIELGPIGIIHSDFKSIQNMPIQPVGDNASKGSIESEIKNWLAEFEC